MRPEDIHAPLVGKDLFRLGIKEMGGNVALVVVTHEPHMMVHAAISRNLCGLLTPPNLLAPPVRNIDNAVWKLHAEPLSNGLHA